MANDMSRAPRYPFARGNPRAEPDARGCDPRQYQQPQQPFQQPPEPPRASPSDPLSELARLIGQTDPFGEAARNSQQQPQRGGGWPGQPQQPAYSAGLPPLMPEYREPPPPPQHDPRYAPPPQQYGAPYADHGREDQYGAPAEYGHRPAGPYYGDDGRLMPQDPYAGDHYDYDEPRPRRRSGLVITVIVLGLALLGTAGAYAYRTMFSDGMSGPPPLIKADTSPSKIVPAQGSADSAAGKQIYDRVGAGGTQDEKVVSREEQPVDVRANARPVTPPGGMPAQGQWPSQPAPNSSQNNQSGQAGSQSEPRKVRTVTIRPDAQGNTAPPPRAAVPPQNMTAPAQNSARTAAAPAGNVPLSLTPGGTVAERTPPAANSTTRSTASAAAPTGVGFMVQVSAQKSEGEASSAFKSAQAKYPNLLGTYEVVLRKKEIAHKGTFYGAQVGPFETRDQATELCAQLKSAGGNCLVEKN